MVTLKDVSINKGFFGYAYRKVSSVKIFRHPVSVLSHHFFQIVLNSAELFVDFSMTLAIRVRRSKGHIGHEHLDKVSFTIWWITPLFLTRLFWIMILWRKRVQIGKSINLVDFYFLSTDFGLQHTRSGLWRSKREIKWLQSHSNILMNDVARAELNGHQAIIWAFIKPSIPLVCHVTKLPRISLSLIYHRL